MVVVRFEAVNESIVAWGRDYDGDTEVPAGDGYIAIAAGGHHNLAIVPEPAALSIFAFGGLALVRRRL